MASTQTFASVDVVSGAHCGWVAAATRPASDGVAGSRRVLGRAASTVLPSFELFSHHGLGLHMSLYGELLSLCKRDENLESVQECFVWNVLRQTMNRAKAITKPTLSRDACAIREIVMIWTELGQVPPMSDGRFLGRCWYVLSRSSRSVSPDFMR